MDDPIYSIEPEKKSSSVVDTLLIVAGFSFMLLAICLLSFLLLRNNALETVSPVPFTSGGGEAVAYDGKQIVHVAAGSTQIHPITYSDQKPVIVMFDADW